MKKKDWPVLSTLPSGLRLPRGSLKLPLQLLYSFFTAPLQLPLFVSPRRPFGSGLETVEPSRTLSNPLETVSSTPQVFSSSPGSLSRMYTVVCIIYLYMYRFLYTYTSMYVYIS